MHLIVCLLAVLILLGRVVHLQLTIFNLSDRLTELISHRSSLKELRNSPTGDDWLLVSSAIVDTYATAASAETAAFSSGSVVSGLVAVDQAISAENMGCTETSTSFLSSSTVLVSGGSSFDVANSASIPALSLSSVQCQQTSAQQLSVQSIVAATVAADAFTALQGTADTVNAVNFTCAQLHSENVTATDATCSSVVADIADVQYINAQSLTMENVASGLLPFVITSSLTATTLTANGATVSGAVHAESVAVTTLQVSSLNASNVTAVNFRGVGTHCYQVGDMGVTSIWCHSPSDVMLGGNIQCAQNTWLVSYGIVLGSAESEWRQGYAARCDGVPDPALQNIRVVGWCCPMPN